MGKQNFDVFLRQEMRLFMYVNVKEEEMAFLRALLRPEDTLGGKKAFFLATSTTILVVLLLMSKKKMLQLSTCCSSSDNSSPQYVFFDIDIIFSVRREVERTLSFSTREDSLQK